MSLLPYYGPAWATHRQTARPEIDFPFFDVGEPTHFTVVRSYEGGRAAYVQPALDSLDPEFDGSSLAATGEADDDTLTLASASPLFTGCPLTVANVVDLTGVTAGAYFAIRISDTAIKLATTPANAVAGTAVAIDADGTCDVVLPAAYLVAAGPRRALPGEAVAYTRTYATVPGQWFDAGSFAYQFPGYAAGGTGSGVAISGITASGANTIFALGATGGAVAGNVVLINVTYTRGGIAYAQTFSAPAVATTNTSQVTVERTLPGSGSFSGISGTVAVFTPGRPEPQTLVVPSRLQHDYVRSTAATAGTDLPPLPAFAPVYATGGSSGQFADVLDTTTLPTAVSYAAQVAARTELVVESDLARYLGNLWVRRTRLVPAS